MYCVCHWILLTAPSPFQVDLGFLRFVTAVGTQGAVSQETKKTYWVKSYKVDVSSNGADWITLKEGSNQKVRELTPHPLCTPLPTTNVVISTSSFPILQHHMYYRSNPQIM